MSNNNGSQDAARVLGGIIAFVAAIIGFLARSGSHHTRYDPDLYGPSRLNNGVMEQLIAQARQFEVDKARAEHAYDPLGALYSLLEHDTAGAFTDEFAEVAIDASQLIWVATANDERFIPEPILNRMNVFQVEAPDADAARTIALRLYRKLRADHAWGQRFEDTPSDAVLQRLSGLAPREMRRAWMTGFGNARLAGRSAIEVADLPDANARRSPIGFVQ